MNAPNKLLGRCCVGAVCFSTSLVTAEVVPSAADVLSSHEVVAELDSYVEGAMDVFEVPGAAVAVIENGKAAYLRGFGARDLEGRAPVDLETRFMIGSVTKSMTTAMAASLIDQGVLDWETPITELLPALALMDPRVTPLLRLRNLFNHSSGVARYDTPLFVDMLEPHELIRSAITFPVVALPGDVFQYQNQMFTLGGFAAARAGSRGCTEQSLAQEYAHLMQQRVFDPVGMPRTTLDFERAIHERNHAWPHSFDPIAQRFASVPIEFERFVSSVKPAGGVWSSIVDMARYAVMQVQAGLNPEGLRVVSAQQLLQTQTGSIAMGGDLQYGFGWAIGYLGDIKLIVHTGGTAGFGSLVALAPDLGMGLVILTNRADNQAFQSAVERYVLELLMGAEHQNDGDLVAEEQAYRTSLSALAGATERVSSQASAPYVGHYAHDVVVSYHDGTLLLKTVIGEIPFLALPQLEGVFIAAHNASTLLTAQFSNNEEGGMTLALGVLDPETLAPAQLLEVSRLHEHHHSTAPFHHDHDSRMTILQRLLFEHGVHRRSKEQPFNWWRHSRQ